MSLTTTPARVLLLKQASAVVTGRAIAAATPKGRTSISSFASRRYAVNMSGAGAEASNDKQDTSSTKEQLPPLSDHEFKAYNRLAERMDWFVSQAFD